MSLPFALLAPVPETHLESGLDTVAESGKVAFGSRAWQVFETLDKMRDDQQVEVYLYASESKFFGLPKVRWKARYVGHVESVGGAHPDDMKYRPIVSGNSEVDNNGYWAIFWEIDNLTMLDKTEAMPMDVFRGYEKTPLYKKSFVPEGPLIVENP